MPTCICNVCKHLNSAMCTACSCCSYRLYACQEKETRVGLRGVTQTGDKPQPAAAPQAKA